MSAFDYSNYNDPKEIGNGNPHRRECSYCGDRLKSLSLNDIWSLSDAELLEIHKDTKRAFQEVHGLEDCYLNLEMDTKSIEVDLHYCQTCGWWRVVKDICIAAEQWQIWDIFYGCVGTSKNLDCNDITGPVKEVRDYLTAKYDARFFIHPRKFEEVVDSVFESMGYNSFITAYSNDGGIDIILDDTDSTVGVQVKRYKEKIKVEQIRAFAGALLLKGCSKGLYITTSDFQPGAYKAAEQFASRTLPIELVNADRFYDALKIVQRKELDLTSLYNLLEKRRIDSLYFYGWETPRNSL